MYYLIHQQSGSTRETQNLHFLRQIADNCFDSDYRIIIADHLISSPINNGDLLKLPTDNEFREFSGWNTGIQFVEKEIGILNLSGVLLTNETLLKHRPFDRAKKRGMVDAIKHIQSAEFPAMAGDIDLIRTQGPYHYPSFDSFYISTYFCFINKASIPLLNIFHLDSALKRDS